MSYVVFSKPDCPYCDQAKALLESKGLAFEERILDIGQVKQVDKTYVTIEQLRNVVPNARTVPQILEDDVLIGGFNALQARLK